ncbi:1187_t:CDS:2 [Acaulospora colombiana]|uniref:1187_t:CDS:1 n=1 Tax=Acaulospora colombiana TaxID=27376 RepID=A0ACA9LZL0_9GLOM|nr:1187_t:CDS:2 [Acaulospora colombiana]
MSSCDYVTDEKSSILEKPFIPKYLRNSPLDIYNRTAKEPILLPTKWNPVDHGYNLYVTENNLGIGYIGRGIASAIRSDHPIPAMAGIYYFEVDIINSGLEK